MGELKRKIVTSMTKPRMVITARSFYSRAEMKLYLKKRIALVIFLGGVNAYIWAVVICQTIPTVKHALASESITLIRGASLYPDEDRVIGGESYDGTVQAVPYLESEEGSAHASAVIAIPSEESITDCHSAAAVFSKKYQVNQDLLDRIIKAESGNKPRVENNHSTATGCFQFVIGTWRLYGKQHWGEEFYTKNIYNPAHNVELATWAISQYGTGAWDASKHIWAR